MHLHLRFSWSPLKFVARHDHVAPPTVRRGVEQPCRRGRIATMDRAWRSKANVRAPFVPERSDLDAVWVSNELARHPSSSPAGQGSRRHPRRAVCTDVRVRARTYGRLHVEVARFSADRRRWYSRSPGPRGERRLLQSPQHGTHPSRLRSEPPAPIPSTLDEPRCPAFGRRDTAKRGLAPTSANLPATYQLRERRICKVKALKRIHDDRCPKLERSSADNFRTVSPKAARRPACHRREGVRRTGEARTSEHLPRARVQALARVRYRPHDA